VPFPFIEKPKWRERPALVVRSLSPAQGVELLWVLMITSAANPSWEGDISLEDRFAECGLPVPCVIRTAKVATADRTHARIQGSIPADIFSQVLHAIER
jgi:mRNA interferase MazF